MAKLNKTFENKYYDINSSIDKYYMNNGVGCLAVKIKKFNDAISRYSGKGYECLDHEFYSYLDRNLRYIPDNVPILLQVYGCKLKEKEKIIIIENIREHYQFKLGEVIEENKLRFKKIMVYLVLAMIFFPLSVITEDSYEMLSNFLNLAFWFYGSSVVTYLAVELKKAKQARARAGQIANMFIDISEKYDDSSISDENKKIITDFVKEANKKDNQ